jgi:predicted AlkP superfamily phosphohydrolase/phosphomutase
MATNNRPQVVVLGVDGATFEVIQPLREMGVLPNLDRLMTEGAVGHLSSTMPPVTGPAWFALATGKSPGKTGVFDFRNRGSSNLLSFDAI